MLFVLGGFMNMKVILVGDPDHGLHHVASLLKESKINTQLVKASVEDESLVLLCVSYQQGPSIRTLESLEKCSGHSLSPLAIVVTECDDSVDPELCDLVCLEMHALVALRIPEDRADSIEMLRDDDPEFVQKVRSLIASQPVSVPFSSYPQEFRSSDVPEPESYQPIGPTPLSDYINELPLSIIGALITLPILVIMIIKFWGAPFGVIVLAVVIGIIIGHFLSLIVTYQVAPDARVTGIPFPVIFWEPIEKGSDEWIDFHGPLLTLFYYVNMCYFALVSLACSLVLYSKASPERKQTIDDIIDLFVSIFIW
jgi:hypothetical protein